MENHRLSGMIKDMFKNTFIGAKIQGSKIVHVRSYLRVEVG